tara:strand:+ start:5525 stop:6004 length:480 start_codon:yes stop_codon:yes gene_type:complete
MMQINIPGLNSTTPLASSWNAFDIADKLSTLDPTQLYRPLIVLKSQFTKKSKAATLNVQNDFAYIERYVNLGVTTSRITEDPADGLIILGTTDFPLGFYDVIIYENTSDENLDPTGLTILWEGLANLELRKEESDTPVPVNYTEYTENDNYVNIINLTN